MASLSELASLLGIDTGTTGVYGTPKKLLDNLERVESSGKADAVNKQSGALGAYQFMPDTVKMLAKQGIVFDPMNKQEARDAADKYIQLLVKQNGGDYQKALAQYGGFKTQDPSSYVSKVTAGVPEVATKRTQQPQEQSVDDLAKQLGVTTAQAAQIQQAAPEQKQTLMEKLTPDDPMGAAATFLKNIGDAVSFGTAKYAAAVPMWATNGGTYAEALERVRDLSKAENQAHPYAALGGQATGGIANAVITGGGSIPRQLATASGGSALQAYTEDKDATLGDAATAAAISLGFAGAGQAASAGLKWLNGRWVKSAVEDANATVKKSNAATLGQHKKQVAEVERANAQAQREWVQSIPEGGAVPPRPVPQPVPVRAAKPNYTPETYRQAVQSGEIPSTTPLQNFNDYWSAAKKNAMPTLAGAAAGAGLGYMLGDNENDYMTPTVASLALGALGGAKANVVNKQLQQFMIKHPGVVEGTVNAASRAVGQPAGSYVTSPEQMGVPQDKSLIRQTIEEYDAKRAAKETLSPEAADLARELGVSQ